LQSFSENDNPSDSRRESLLHIASDNGNWNTFSRGQCVNWVKSFKRQFVLWQSLLEKKSDAHHDLPTDLLVLQSILCHHHLRLKYCKETYKGSELSKL
jgi:hypothetical protein